MLLESNVKIVVDRFRPFYEKISSHRRIFMSSSNSLLVVARLANVNFTLATRTIYRFLSWSIRVNLMFCNFHTCYSTWTSTSHSTSLDALLHEHSSSLEIFTHDRSSSFDALVAITHRLSRHLSRSLIITRRTRHDHSSSLDAFVTIIHRFSKHLSRSFIITRSIRYDRSSSLEILLDII